MVIDVQQVEPGGDVLAFWGDCGVKLVEIGSAFWVHWGALFAERRPGGDFAVTSLMLRMGGDPGQDFAVALSGGELFFEHGGIDSGKFQKTFIQRAGVFVVADFAGKERATLIEHAWQNDVSAEPHTGAAGRAFCEIGSFDGHSIKSVE